MCGFVGFVERGPVSDTLARMNARISHRGPDGEGTWFGGHDDWRVALGHRRLSIIDLALGSQPMLSADGRLALVYNGEIFNFQELRDELVRTGGSFRTRSDTEVLLELLRIRGEAELGRLNGMFAFAAWRAESGELLLARDRSGIKPLYYGSLPDGGIVFGSELSALLVHPRAPRGVRLGSLADFFFSDYVPPPRTIIGGIFKLPPGHSIVWKDGRLGEPRPFGDSDPIAPADPATPEAELRDRLRAAVERQLVSDVPLGVFLSGGIDSSLVAAVAAQILRDRNGEPVRTFTIGFENRDYDESPYARRVAEHIGSRHTEEILTESEVIASLEDCLKCLDEPNADPSILPTWVLSRLASRHVKVALGGDGGDELWAGYPTYKAHRLARVYGLTPRVVHDRIISPALSRVPPSDRRWSLEWKMKRFVNRWDDDPYRRHLRWMGSTDLPQLAEAFPRWDGRPALFDSLEEWQLPRPADLNALLELDYRTYLPGSVLSKVDRASMAHGLEVRPPFLDTEFVAWAKSLPARFKLRGTTKYLLKHAGRPLLPDEILFRGKKGFGIPVSAWLRGPLRERVVEIFRESPLWDSGAVSRDFFATRFDRHLAMKDDSAKTLWALLVVDNWMKKERIDVVQA